MPFIEQMGYKVNEFDKEPEILPQFVFGPQDITIDFFVYQNSQS